ncbi:conserved hypothetical protein [Rhodopseudomonas palustris HaA2]|uniref:DUF2147 domain-containing protein n=1 Tax=Rhodopseudomonas palustris (strain HaA2) TaxID=316058 RepID=Q2ITD0_RHOP2|nr:DUF2147 domain-containing protein [Rhodopseudomonas palustris]ABD08530.1 conserved hypothetical protein [Rhodopseudomonas palustris HaA2]
MNTHRPIRIVAWAAVAAFTYLLAAAAPAAAAEPTAVGLWQRTDTGKPTGKPVVWVLMLDRGNNLYEGIVAKTFAQPGQPEIAVCEECEDDRKDQPVLGISLIRDMKRKGRVYENGNILDPRNGDVWKAMLTVSPDGQILTLRGYLMTPALGKDEDWFRLPDTAIAQLDPAIVAKFMPEQAAAAAAPVGAKPGTTAGKAKAAPALMQKGGMMAPPPAK